MGFLAALLSALLNLTPSLAPQPAATAVTEQAKKEELTVELAPAPRKADTTLPPIYGPQGRPLVVLDPGHGGYDPGSHSPYSRTNEKQVTLALARAIKDELVASGKVRVALTREDDRYLVLRDRYELARRLGADLFISVHADAAPRSDRARGATIYTLSEVASGKEAALLAAQENKSDIIGGVDLGRQKADVTNILIELTQRESMAESAEVANLLHREASAFFPFRPKYHQFASLIVLKAPDMPSILFESGYLTNRQDSAYIQSAEGRQQIATGMRRAIETYFARQRIRTARR
jgi:N-acetylmuramoyl-L-alanine amidase